jgi:hypothetical protein
MSVGSEYEYARFGPSGVDQAKVVADQQAALKEGYNWTPTGWNEKTNSNAPPVGSTAWNEQQKMLKKLGTSPGAGGQNPTMLSANHQQETFDPWSKYRGAAGDKLWAKEQAGDPSDVYRNRLEEMQAPGNGANFQSSDPSYNFRFEQGQKALERSLAGKGLLNSGNALARIQEYGQSAASQEFQAQFQRTMQSMDGVSKQYDVQQQRLMKMAGIDNDPAMAAKLNLQAEGVNTDRMNTANNYNLGMTQAENNRYATDVGAATTRGSASYKSSGGGSKIDTESLFAGDAKEAVYSANWWDNQENGNGSSMSSY